MRPDQKERLRDMQEKAVDNAIDEFDLANTFGIEDADDRIQRSYLVGMATKSVSLAAKIEQYFSLRKVSGWKDAPDDKELEKEARELEEKYLNKVIQIRTKRGKS